MIQFLRPPTLRSNASRLSAITISFCLFIRVYSFSLSPDTLWNDQRVSRKSTIFTKVDAGKEVFPEIISTSSDNLPRQVYSRKKSRDIAFSFESTEFRPVWWSRNCHFQTIAGALFRGKKISFSESTHPFVDDNHSMKWDKRERFETLDGDFFDVDFAYTPSQSRGLVIVTHGLESNSKSPFVADLALGYLGIGMDVACISFRGCSGDPNRTWGAYNLGFTDDLMQFIEHLKEIGYEKPLYLSGFSLGGNVILKLLGELGNEATTKFNVRGAAVASVPLDCVHRKIDEPGFNQLVYANNFLKTLKRKAADQVELLGSEGIPFDFERMKRATTVFEFDDSTTSQIYGYDSALDYYRKCASKNYIDHITVPTAVIFSHDDPFFDTSYFPVQNDMRPVRFITTDYGGHGGFMFNEKEDSVKSEETVFTTSSWLPSECSRFLDHVHNKLLEE